MGQYLLALAAALVVGAVVFGITVLVTGSDPGLGQVEPDGRATPLPGTRPLLEGDVEDVRFDTAWRGYRMAQVDAALRRAAYDIGYKDELIGVLEAEVAALREGRMSDAEVLRRAREAALVPVVAGAVRNGPDGLPHPDADDDLDSRAAAAADLDGPTGADPDDVLPAQDGRAGVEDPDTATDVRTADTDDTEPGPAGTQDSPGDEARDAPHQVDAAASRPERT